MGSFVSRFIGFLSNALYVWKTNLTAMYKLATISRDEYEAFMESYILFDGDWSNKNGKAEKHIVDYYNIINHLCSLGNVEKMYIPPLMSQNAGVFQNQILYERKMMKDINVSPGMNCIDIGCGRGRVASHVCREGGANMTGINIDPSQLKNARDYAKRVGIEDKCRFLQGSINDPLPFPDESFDAAYNIQAFTYSKDKYFLFREIYRILKPGARFCMLDWVLLPNYDPKNPEHVDLIARTMPFIGAVDNPPVSLYEDAMKKAGFKVVISEDASMGGHQGSLISMERNRFAWVRVLVRTLVRVRILPKYFPDMMLRLRTNADAFNRSDELRIATSSYQIVCEKPAKA